MDQFAVWLVELRALAGEPSLAELSELTGRVPRGRKVPKSTVGKVFQGGSLPSVDDAVAIAGACELYADRGARRVAEAQAQCRQRWTRAKAAQQAAKLRPVPPPRAEPVDGPESRAGQGFLEKYRSSAVAVLDTMELFGVTLRSSDFRYRMSTSYINLSVARRRAGGPPDPPESALPVEQAIGATERVLIRGDAGSGKTTLLKWIAVGALRSTLPQQMRMWNGAIPFFLPLRHFADRELPTPDEFLDYAARTLASAAPEGFVRDILDSPHGIVLIDGVDELPAQRRAEVRSWLAELTGAYPHCRYVITARQAAVGELWLHDMKFESFELAPMSAADQSQFIAYWHATMRSAATDEEERQGLEAHEQALVRSFSERRELRRLGSNPLLCALLCALHWDREMQLPDERMKLYEAALDMLLVRRDRQRGIAGGGPQLRSDVQQLLLRKLAYWMIRNGLTEISFAQLAHRVGGYLDELVEEPPDAADVAHQLLVRTGLLRSPAVGRVDFVHRTFQEYLAAQQLLNDGDLDLLIKQAHEDQWQDVVVMVAGQARDAERNHLVGSLLRRAEARREEPHRVRLTILAVDCASGAVSLDPELRREARRRAGELIPPQDTHQARALAGLGEVVLDLMPGPGAELAPNEVQMILYTCQLMGGPSAMRVMARFARHADRTTELRLGSLWPQFDRAQYAKVVLSQVRWTGPLTVDAEALGHLSHLTGLGYLRVRGPAGDYGPLGVPTGLSILTLEHPDPALPGLRLPASLYSLGLSGPVRHDAFRALAVRGLGTLAFNDVVCPDCGRTAWEMLADWPAEARRSVRSLSLKGPLDRGDPHALGERFPALETLTVRSESTPDWAGMESYLTALGESASLTDLDFTLGSPAVLGWWPEDVKAPAPWTSVGRFTSAYAVKYQLTRARPQPPQKAL